MERLEIETNPPERLMETSIICYCGFQLNREISSVEDPGFFFLPDNKFCRSFFSHLRGDLEYCPTMLRDCPSGQEKKVTQDGWDAKRY